MRFCIIGGAEKRLGQRKESATMAKKKANGEGSITRYKDGRWCARHTFHTPNGPKRKAFYGRTKQEALAKRNKALADSHNGLLVFDAENLTLGEYLKRWLNDAVS